MVVKKININNNDNNNKVLIEGLDLALNSIWNVIMDDGFDLDVEEGMDSYKDEYSFRYFSENYERNKYFNLIKIISNLFYTKGIKSALKYFKSLTHLEKEKLSIVLILCNYPGFIKAAGAKQIQDFLLNKVINIFKKKNLSKSKFVLNALCISRKSLPNFKKALISKFVLMKNKTVDNNTCKEFLNLLIEESFENVEFNHLTISSSTFLSIKNILIILKNCSDRYKNYLVFLLISENKYNDIIIKKLKNKYYRQKYNVNGDFVFKVLQSLFSDFYYEKILFGKFIKLWINDINENKNANKKLVSLYGITSKNLTSLLLYNLVIEE